MIFMDKGAYRKIRSRLKRRINHGAKLNRNIIKKYHLKKYQVRNYGNLQTLSLNIPETFCLIENHEDSIGYFEAFEKVLNDRRPHNLHIQHEKTKVIGLSASYIFDKQIKEYVRKWKMKGAKVRLSGTISNEKSVNNFLLAYGILNELGIKPNFGEGLIDPDYINKFVTFKFPGSGLQDYLSSIASVGLAEYFNECFMYKGFGLDNSAMLDLGCAFGEIIGNAEEHSNERHKRWYALGCYDKDTNYCMFAIINYGLTIYESLKYSQLSANILDKAQRELSINHSMIKKILGEKDTEPLWNLMALQDGISSKRSEIGRSRSRGQGLMDVLRFVERLKHPEDITKIAIVSGNSKILIDYDYPIRVKTVNRTEERRVISFNASGELSDPQDPKKIIHLKKGFPGTIITGKFKLNDQALLKLSRSL